MIFREDILTENNDSGGMASRAEEFLQVFKKGAEFTQGLLKENERLRYRVLELEQQLRTEGPSAEIERLQEKLRQSEAEKAEILSRISSIEQEGLDFANRYAEIEAENNLLANLYITTYQLHSTFDVDEIVRIIEEVLLNLVGAEKFSLLLLNEQGQLVPALSGESTGGLPAVGTDDPCIARALAQRQAWIADTDELSQLAESAIKAVVPLQVDNEVIGALVIYRLLAQKTSFSDIDEEIFNLLGGHAAMAICTALLHRERPDRTRFVRGFLSGTK